MDISQEEFMSAFKKSDGKRAKTAQALGISPHYADKLAKGFGVKFSNVRTDEDLTDQPRQIFMNKAINKWLKHKGLLDRRDNI